MQPSLAARESTERDSDGKYSLKGQAMEKDFSSQLRLACGSAMPQKSSLALGQSLNRHGFTSHRALGQNKLTLTREYLELWDAGSGHALEVHAMPTSCRN